MPLSTLFDRVYCPRAMIECHARRCPIVGDGQGPRCQATADVVWLYILWKGYDGMSCLTSYLCVCSLRETIAYHAHRCPTVCLVQGLWWLATREVVQICVLSKGYGGMPRPTLSDHVFFKRAMMEYHAKFRHSNVLSKGHDFMPFPMSSELVCFLKSMMACHA